MELELDPGIFQSLLHEWAGQSDPAEDLHLLESLTHNIDQLSDPLQTRQRNRPKQSTA